MNFERDIIQSRAVCNSLPSPKLKIDSLLNELIKYITFFTDSFR